MDLAIVLGAGLGMTVTVALVLGRELRLSSKLGNIEVTVKGIDKAVNRRPSGEPPLVEQVTQAAADISECKDTIHRVDDKIDGHLGWHKQSKET